MIKFENTKVYNLANAIYSARNPLNSWHQSDSDLEKDVIGENDMKLAQKLIKAGDPSHRKFLRQIFVSVNITAPLYWWKEADQTKVATVTNSCSTMHKVHAKEFTLEDFSHEHLEDETNGWIDDANGNKWCSALTHMETTVNLLNAYRCQYIKTKDKKYWYHMIQLLPSSYNQLRTLTLNYENIATMVHQRKGHKLDEWRVGFIEWARTLPYASELIFFDEKPAESNPLDDEIKKLWNSGMGKKRISQKCHVTTEYVASVVGGK